MKCTKAELLEALHDLVGDAGRKTSPADLDTYGKDWTRVYTPSPVAIVLPADTDDLERPLQLLARSLAFTDPISGEPRRFESRRQLAALTDTDRLKPGEVAAAARR